MYNRIEIAFVLCCIGTHKEFRRGNTIIKTERSSGPGLEENSRWDAGELHLHSFHQEEDEII